MRRRRIKFPLILRDGAEVNRIAALRDNFDLEKILGYFSDGRLITWLDDRFYHDEMDALKNLDTAAPDLPEKICAIFDIPVDEKITDAIETIAWRNERLARLKKFTSDENILRQVDFVAFDQDDFEDIIREENSDVIYLCDNVFEFPSGILRKKNLIYIGVGNVEAVILSRTPIDFTARHITFKNIKFDSKYADLANEKNVSHDSNYAKLLEESKKLNPNPTYNSYFGNFIDDEENYFI